MIVNKGDDENPNVRARLVAKEIKNDSRLDMFAATPPLEAKKFLISRAATSGWLGAKKGHRKLIFIDIKRAYMYAPEMREIYVELPTQDADHGMCGKLNKSMYGTRGAAQSWEGHYSHIYIDVLGFEQGRASPCCFYHKARDLRVVVCGDDFTARVSGRQASKNP